MLPSPTKQVSDLTDVPTGHNPPSRMGAAGHAVAVHAVLHRRGHSGITGARAPGLRDAVNPRHRAPPCLRRASPSVKPTAGGRFPGSAVPVPRSIWAVRLGHVPSMLRGRPAEGVAKVRSPSLAQPSLLVGAAAGDAGGLTQTRTDGGGIWKKAPAAQRSRNWTIKSEVFAATATTILEI
ncbi:unnamed protein product [Urochloa humidicola]